MNLFRKIVLLFFFVSGTGAFAQVIPFISEKSLAPEEKYSIQTWTTENGLPQNSINDIIQTKDGYLWLATFDGLVKFDGIKFSTYNTTNTPELKTNAVKRMFVDNEGRLWITPTDGSLIRYYKGKFHSFSLPSKVLFFNSAITNWGNSSVLAACENNKIYLIDQDNYSEFPIPGYIKGINTIISKYDDQLYLGTKQGVYSYCNKTWTNYENLKGINAFALYRSPNNDVIADINNHLYVIHPKSADEIAIPVSLPEIGNHTIGFNEKQQLCILSEKGIFSISGDRITVENGLSSNGVGSMYVDKQNNLWVGTSNGGLNKLKAKLFTTLSKENGMSDDGVTGLLETRDAGIFIGNNCGGMSEYKDQKFQHNIKGIGTSCVWALLEDDEKNTFIGTYGSGVLIQSKTGNQKYYSIEQGLSGNVVFSLYKDSKNIIWAGTNHGLSYFRNDRFVAFDSTFKNTITYIFEDRNKQLFLCSDAGLFSIINQKISPLENKGLKGANVRYIYEDDDGVLWIGTHGNGLVRFKNGIPFSFDAKYTPLDNNVWSISEDEQGNFWLPSNSGMYVVARKELNDLADGIIKNISPVFLSKEDGLKSIEFNGGFQPTVLKSREGKFWFPTVKGVAIVDPTKLKRNDFSPQIVIEKIVLNDEQLPLTDSLTLSSSASNLLISFTAPSFTNPSKIQFQYKMEGIDNSWIDIGTAREIKLNKIPSNTHILRIRVAGNGNTKETGIVIFKPLPFWKQTKFITGVSLILIFLILVITVGVISYIRKREKLKTQLNKQYASIELKALQAQLNPHFIFNCLNSIQHFIIVNDELSASKYLTKFSMLMRKFLEHSKFNTVTLQEEMELLRLYIELEALRSKNKFSLNMKIDPNLDIFNIEIPSMLFQPFVENAINHGLLNLERTGTLSISFYTENSYLVGIIEDDGVGREKAEALKSETRKDHSSRGMEIIKERITVLNFIENIKIEMEIIDKTDDKGTPTGTKVIIKIPI